MTVTRPLYTFSRFWPLVCVAALLGYTFRLFHFAYFSLDDFNNLFLIQNLKGGELLRHVLDPGSALFRPLGLAAYWLVFHAADLDPAPYHAVAWSLHTINVALLYIILRDVVKSHAGAAVGAMLFACQASFSEIFFSFGTIFELLSTLLFFSALLAYLRLRSRAWQTLNISLLFFFAMKAKEMAITLPLVLMTYDVIVTRREHRGVGFRHWGLRTLVVMSIPILLACWFVAMKGHEISVDRTNPYYMELSLRTAIDGYGWYANRLSNLNTHWSVYVATITVAILVAVRTGQRQVVFFLAYIALTFLPVIFLVNHRFPFYWYLPFLGVAGVAASLVKIVNDCLSRVVTYRWLTTAGLIVLPFVSRELYFQQKAHGTVARVAFQTAADDFRPFISGLRALSTPGPNSTLFFTSMPLHFDETRLLSAVHVALQRKDVSVLLVSPPPAQDDVGVEPEGPHPIKDVLRPGDNVVVLRYEKRRLFDDTRRFASNPQAFLHCSISTLHSIRLSETDVVAGRDAYTLFVSGIQHVHARFLYKLNNEPARIFSAQLDGDGRATFTVAADTPKGIYRFLGFNIGGAEWIRSDAAITVH